MLTYPMLNDRPIDQWTVTELKDELQRRNLRVSDLKDDLVKRLFEAIQGEILDGGEKTSGGSPCPEELKGDETPGSFDTYVNQASIEPHVDEGASEVTKQGADLVISVTEAYDESILATSEITQEAVAGTAEASQRSLDAVAEVDSILVDTAATDETNGDGLESSSSGNTIVKEADPHSEGVSDTLEKNPEDDTNHKMTDDGAPSDVTSGDIKLGLDLHSKILEVDDVIAPPDDIMLHCDNGDTDSVAGPKDAGIVMAAESMIPSNGHGDPKCTNGDSKPILCWTEDQVSEVNPYLDSQIQCVSIFQDNMFIIEKNDVKGNLNAEDCDLELETNQEMIKPASTNPSPGDHLQVLGADKQLHKNGTSLQELGSTTNIDLDKEEESPNGSYCEKLNLDRSSGESMDEDVMESKHVDSNIEIDELGGNAEVTPKHVLKRGASP